MNSEHFSFWDQFGWSNWQIFDKKSFFFTLKSRLTYLKYQMCQIPINSGQFNFGTNLSLK